MPKQNKRTQRKANNNKGKRGPKRGKKYTFKTPVLKLRVHT